MKCCSMKLTHRQDSKKVLLREREKEERFSTSQTHSYAYPHLKCTDANPSLSIVTLNPPEKSFNTGSSLTKWSQKPARLKSCLRRRTPIAQDDIDFCYEHLDSDYDDLLLLKDSTFEDDDAASNDSMSNLHYHVHSDIERLLSDQFPEKTPEEEDDEVRVATKKKKQYVKDLRSKTKTIKFSISKPPSPQTEQVIRVEVISTSSAMVDSDGLIDGGRGGGGNDGGKGNVERRDEFEIRCKQFAFGHRRKSNLRLC